MLTPSAELNVKRSLIVRAHSPASWGSGRGIGRFTRVYSSFQKKTCVSLETSFIFRAWVSQDPRGASASYKKSIFFHEEKGSPFLALLGSSSDAPRAPKSALGASSGRPQGSKVRDVSCEMHVFKKATGTSLELLFERRRCHQELPDHFRAPLRDPKWQPWVQN